MKLWFENHDGIEREIARVETWKDVHEAIDKFIADCNAHKPVNAKPFRSFYTRIWRQPDGRFRLDVGSHTEFFITDLPYEGDVV